MGKCRTFTGRAVGTRAGTGSLTEAITLLLQQPNVRPALVLAYARGACTKVWRLPWPLDVERA